MDYLCHPSRKEREFMSPLLSEQKMITEQRAVSGLNLQKKKKNYFYFNYLPFFSRISFENSERKAIGM